MDDLQFPNGIAVTVGFVASFVALALPYQLGLGAPWGAALLVVLAVTGVVVARADGLQQAVACATSTGSMVTST